MAAIMADLSLTLAQYCMIRHLLLMIEAGIRGEAYYEPESSKLQGNYNCTLWVSKTRLHHADALRNMLAERRDIWQCKGMYFILMNGWV